MNIEKNVPMPTDTFGGARDVSKYPFNDMDVGDSVFFDGQKSTGAAANMARKTAERKNKKFAVRSEAGGIRIWRTK